MWWCAEVRKPPTLFPTASTRDAGDGSFADEDPHIRPIHSTLASTNEEPIKVELTRRLERFYVHPGLYNGPYLGLCYEDNGTDCVKYVPTIDPSVHPAPPTEGFDVCPQNRGVRETHLRPLICIGGGSGCRPHGAAEKGIAYIRQLGSSRARNAGAGNAAPTSSSGDSTWPAQALQPKRLLA